MAKETTGSRSAAEGSSGRTHHEGARYSDFLLRCKIVRPGPFVPSLANSPFDRLRANGLWIAQLF